MKGPQNQNEPAEASEALNALLPVVVEVEKKHLWLGCLEDSITEFFNLQAGLEG